MQLSMSELSIIAKALSVYDETKDCENSDLEHLQEKISCLLLDTVMTDASCHCEIKEFD